MSKVLQVHQWSDDAGEYYNVWAIPLNMVTFASLPEFASGGINKDYYLGQFRGPQDYIEIARAHGCSTILITLESE